MGAYGPTPVLPRRHREALLGEFATAAGADRVASAHETWNDVIGPPRLDATLTLLVEYAVEAGRTGRPAPVGDLADRVRATTLVAVRASIALAALAVSGDQSAVDLAERLTGSRPRSPLVMARDGWALAATAPVTTLLAGWSIAGRVILLAAPTLPAVEVGKGHQDNEASLLAHLVADAAPRYLGGAVARILVGRVPMSIAIGVRSGRQGVTIRLGRGAVSVEDGVSPDAVVVFDGGLDELLEDVGDALVHDLAGVAERDDSDR
ncbi:MAG: hypothetical protein ABI276_01030 [Acidimicrobiales bacterium]